MPAATATNTGRIEEIQGVVIEAVFPEKLPEIYNAISVTFKGQGDEDQTLVCEVQQHLGDNRVRAVAMIGAGDALAPVTVRAPAWDALVFPDDGNEVVVLAETPPSTSATRTLLARAADARKRVLLLDRGNLRPLAINDLVGRQLGAVDWARIAHLIAGKRVLITGGGGSIGGELARRVATLSPARLTLLDSSEFNLYKISHELPHANLALADVRDEVRPVVLEAPALLGHKLELFLFLLV